MSTRKLVFLENKGAVVRNYFNNLKISTSIALVSMTLLVVSLSMIGIIIYSIVSSQISETATNRQNTSLRTAAIIAEKQVPGMTVKWGEDNNVSKVFLKDKPAFSNHIMIDEIGRATGETATIFLWDDKTSDFWRKTTNIVKPNGKRAVGTPLGKKGAVYPVVTKGITFRGEAVILGLAYYTIYQPIFSQDGKVIGILYAGVKKEKINAILSEIGSKFGIAFFVILVISIVLMLFISSRMLKPILKLTDITRRIASDDLDVEVPYADRSNEIGRMAQSVEILKKRSEERLSLSADQVKRDNARDERQKKFKMLADGFRKIVLELIESVSDKAQAMEGTAHSLSEVASESSEKATGATRASQQATDHVNSVAIAAEQLSSSITDIRGQVVETTNIVNFASKGANLANKNVSSLAEAVSKIGDVIGLIQEIAEQTNLLALNATIEAARAGEMGKGFSVVAAEVKELSTQTSKATDEIRTHITAIQASTTEAVDSIQSITKTMGDVNSYTSAIEGSIEEQGVATNEISDSVLKAAEGTGAVTDNMNDLSETVGITNQSAGEVLAAAKVVSENTDELLLEINRFLENVEAA